jgi:ubiquinone/menaquinone biosynthesis C-methylase UbiE
MENKPKQLSETELQELAAQLRCPDGGDGIKVGEMMNFTNGNMIAKAVEVLQIDDNDSILEIGPGNGLHAEDILNRGQNIHYTGIDISTTMVEEARKLNSGSSAIRFELTDGITIPFGNGHFTKLFTTNTIYFWEHPEDYAKEIARVLKPGGMVVIGFIPKRVMEKIPFAKYGFTLYGEETVTGLLEGAGLEIVSQISEKELVTGNHGQTIEREFMIISAKS